jgi:hypothetical protein
MTSLQVKLMLFPLRFHLFICLSKDTHAVSDKKPKVSANSLLCYLQEFFMVFWKEKKEGEVRGSVKDNFSFQNTPILCLQGLLFGICLAGANLETNW